MVLYFNFFNITYPIFLFLLKIKFYQAKRQYHRTLENLILENLMRNIIIKKFKTNNFQESIFCSLLTQ